MVHENKRKRLRDRAHWSLRLIPSSTFVKAPEHTNMSWKKQKQWIKPAWIQIPAPLCVHWIISGKRLQSLSLKKNQIYCQDWHGLQMGQENLSTREAALGPGPLSSSCMCCALSLPLVLSMSLLYISLSSASQILPTRGSTSVHIFTPSVCIPSFLTSILPCDFSKQQFLEVIKSLPQYS